VTISERAYQALQTTRCYGAAALAVYGEDTNATRRRVNAGARYYARSRDLPLDWLPDARRARPQHPTTRHHQLSPLSRLLHDHRIAGGYTMAQLRAELAEDHGIEIGECALRGQMNGASVIRLRLLNALAYVFDLDAAEAGEVLRLAGLGNLAHGVMS